MVWSTDGGLCSALRCRADEARRQQQGADSYIGAIMDVCDADDGEVVEEDGMFDMVYSGHCNKQGCKEVRPSPCCMSRPLSSAPSLAMLHGWIWESRRLPPLIALGHQIGPLGIGQGLKTCCVLLRASLSAQELCTAWQRQH